MGRGPTPNNDGCEHNARQRTYSIFSRRQFRENAENLGARIEEDIHLNPNSGKEEFSIRDLDGYYLTITRYHDYGIK